MTKKELQEENKKMREALERIMSIKDDPIVLKEMKEYPDRSIYPFMVGVVESIAKYALTKDL